MIGRTLIAYFIVREIQYDIIKGKDVCVRVYLHVLPYLSYVIYL